MPRPSIPVDKCSQCHQSICCTYVTHPLDTPRGKADFQYLLWLVSHGNIEIYKDEDGWCLLIPARCQHLQGDGRCGIYATRPPICREHDNSHCEFDQPAEQDFDLYFRNYDELLKYCRKRFRTWDA